MYALNCSVGHSAIANYSQVSLKSSKSNLQKKIFQNRSRSNNIIIYINPVIITGCPTMYTHSRKRLILHYMQIWNNFCLKFDKFFLICLFFRGVKAVILRLFFFFTPVQDCINVLGYS